MLQVVSGEKVVGVVPPVMPCSAAQATSLAHQSGTSVNAGVSGAGSSVWPESPAQETFWLIYGSSSSSPAASSALNRRGEPM